MPTSVESTNMRLGAIAAVFAIILPLKLLDVLNPIIAMVMLL